MALTSYQVPLARIVGGGGGAGGGPSSSELPRGSTPPTSPPTENDGGDVGGVRLSGQEEFEPPPSMWGCTWRTSRNLWHQEPRCMWVCVCKTRRRNAINLIW